MAEFGTNPQTGEAYTSEWARRVLAGIAQSVTAEVRDRAQAIAILDVIEHVVKVSETARDERVRDLSEALREVLDRFDHLCNVLVVRDETFEIGQRARRVLGRGR